MRAQNQESDQENDQKSDLRRPGTQPSGRFTKSSHFRPGRAGKMGGHHATRAQRVDLLGYLRQEAGNPKGPRGAGTHAPQRRTAPALLLARLSSPLKIRGWTMHPATGLQSSPELPLGCETHACLFAPPNLAASRTCARAHNPLDWE